MRRLLAFAAALVVAAALALTRAGAPAGPTGAWLVAARLEPRFEQVEGLRVRYLRVGRGPTLVLIHGLASSIYTWRHVLPELARDHDVLALDLPGFGASDQPTPLHPGTLPAVVVGLMDRLGIERASFVGNSLGGAVGVMLAAAHPERVERLVLIDSAGFNLTPEGRPWVVRVAAGPAGAVLKHLPVRRSLVTLALRQVFDDDALVTPGLVDEYLAPLQRPTAFDSIGSLLRGRDLPPDAFRRLAAQVRAPTLVIWGSEDRWIPPQHADLLCAAIPGARKVVIAGCGHMPQEERPAEILALLREFLVE